jgi:ATP-dependent Clp protease, protease subunit
MSYRTRFQKRRIQKNEDTDEEDKEIAENINVLENKIYFYTDINTESVLSLRTELEKLISKHLIFSIKNDCDPIPIKLYINSLGGEVTNALIIVDLIKSSKVPIHTIIEGEAASAATLISVVGHKRFITKNSHMLIHQIRGGVWGKMTEFEDEMMNMKMFSKKLKKIYRENTCLSKEDLNKILKKEIEWDSKTCLEYGLVDTILG